MSTIAACPREPDNQGNQNLHLRDSLLVFGSGSERLTAKSYGSTPLFAAARSFSANVGSNLYWVYRGLDSLPFGEEIRSFYLFEYEGTSAIALPQQVCQDRNVESIHQLKGVSHERHFTGNYCSGR
ncbi:hypothetical protein, partial [Polaromonas sp. AET17H-212]|uniref:hypothetical protein n=1 Tax=Polaromonas sp. AET17H-212 TaxID=1977061 RepID=UPI001C3ED8B6